MAWDVSHDSVVDCSIRTLLKMYKCAQMYEWKHTQMLLSMTKSMMTSVVLINEQSYQFTNASKVLLKTPRNDIATSFMQEKLFKQLSKQLQECAGCRCEADCFFCIWLSMVLRTLLHLVGRTVSLKTIQSFLGLLTGSGCSSVGQLQYCNYIMNDRNAIPSQPLAAIKMTVQWKLLA